MSWWLFVDKFNIDRLSHLPLELIGFYAENIIHILRRQWYLHLYDILNDGGLYRDTHLVELKHAIA